MKLVGQAWIYWRNLQATTERRREMPVTTWAEMKSRLREKFVPACYRSMIIDEWNHLQQGDGSVVDYIARFDDLMIRCNVDKEPVATLARFRAGLRLEYQRELVMHEVSTLEKAYRYTTNMELYSSHAQKISTTWFSACETTRSLQSALANVLPIPLPTISPSATAILPLPHPPLRLLLPPVPPVMPTTPTTGRYGTRARIKASSQPVLFAASPFPATERPPEGRNMGGVRPRPSPAQPNTANSRIACFKCQGWGHFVSQCPS